MIDSLSFKTEIIIYLSIATLIANCTMYKQRSLEFFFSFHTLQHIVCMFVFVQVFIFSFAVWNISSFFSSTFHTQTKSHHITSTKGTKSLYTPKKWVLKSGISSVNDITGNLYSMMVYILFDQIFLSCSLFSFPCCLLFFCCLFFCCLFSSFVFFVINVKIRALRIYDGNLCVEC